MANIVVDIDKQYLLLNQNHVKHQQIYTYVNNQVKGQLILIINTVFLNMIIKMNQRQQLIRNLFISAQSKDYEANFKKKKMVSPDFLRIIIQEIGNQSEQQKKQFIKKLLDYFTTFSENSLILHSKQVNLLDQYESILNDVVIFLMKNIKKQQQMELYIKLIRNMVQYYQIILKNINRLTYQLAQDFHFEKLNNLRFRFIINVFKVYYLSKPPIKNQPLNFFYLFGKESGIKVIKSGSLKWPFHKAMSFVMYFSYDHTEYKRYLIELQTDNQQELKIYISGRKLHIQLPHETKLEICEVQANIWYYFSFEYLFQEGRISVYLNEKNYCKNHIPKLLFNCNTQRKINDLTFGKDFQGKINSIFLINGTLSTSFNYQQMPLGIQTWAVLKKILSQKKILENCVIGYHPFITQKLEEKKIAYDIYRKYHGQFLLNTTVYDNKFDTFSVEKLYGLKTILPFFYLIEFYKEDENMKNLLQDVMQLAMILFQKKYKNIEGNAIQSRFFPIMSMLVNQLPPKLITLNFIKLIKQFKNYIHDRTLKKQFFKLIWNLKVYQVNNDKIIQAYYQILLSSYQNNLSFYENAFSMQSVLYYTIRNLENVSNNCCVQHYVNQSLLVNDPIIKDQNYKEKSYYKLHLKYIKQIIIFIIKEFLKNDYKRGLDQIRSLLRLLLQNYSVCFYLNLLNIIKTIFKMEEQQNREAQLILKECNIISFMQIVPQKTINPDLIAQMLQILFFLYSKFKNSMNDRKLVLFVISMFRKIPIFYSNSKNNLKIKMVKNTRKRSADQISKVDPNQDYLKNLKQVLSKTPQTISNSQKIYEVIKKFYCNNWIKHEIGDEKINNEQGIKVMSQFYKIAKRQIKQIILIELLSIIKFNRQNISFVSTSLAFKKFMIDILQSEQHNRPISFELAVRIMATLTLELLECENFIQFYISLKAIVSYKKQSDNYNTDSIWIILMETIKLIHPTLNNLAKIKKLFIVCAMELIQSQNIQKENQNFLNVINQLLQNIYETVRSEYVFIAQQDFQERIFVILLKQGNTSNKLKQFFLFEITGSIHNTNTISENEEQPMFLIFDNLLNKSLIKIQEKLQVDSSYKKKIYIIELYMKATFKYLQVLQSNAIELENEIKKLIRIFIVFITQMTYEKKQNIDIVNNILGRKILFQIYHFFYFRIQNSTFKQSNQIYINGLIKLFTFLFSYVQYIDNELGKHKTLAALMNKIRDLKRTHYNPFVLQFFQLAFKNCQNKSFLTLNEIIGVVKQKYVKLKQRIFQEDFLYVFNRPTIRDVLKICDQKDFIYFKYLLEIPIQELVLQLSKNFTLDLEDIQIRLNEDIHKTFDNQNPLEEKTRLQFLNNQQQEYRQSARSWKKLWKLLRIYNMPYGIWMNQRQILKYNNFQDKYKNFKLKLSKYCTQSGYRPILRAKIIQPWIIIKKKYQYKNQIQLNINLIPKSQNIKSWTKNNNKLFLWNRWNKIKEVQYKQFRVVQIKDSIKIKGFLMFCSEYLLFRFDGANQEDSHFSFSQFKIEIQDQVFKKWYYIDILNVTKRRYLGGYTSVEIKLTDFTSILFQIQQRNIQLFIEEVLKIRKNLSLKYKQLIHLNKVKFFTNQFNINLPKENDNLTKLTDKWRLRSISNFQYLISINNLASRSIHDYSQYPVFPWIVQGAESKSPKYRDLNKTMGGLGANQRIQVLKQKFNSNDPFNPVPPFYYGTHYSSPGVVFNYLIRLSPFTQCCKQLQGGKFDLADRMFFSLISSWKSATKQMSDVRQLIPEFYYLPEMFLNIENYNLGVMQNGQKVTNVELPKWAANPYHFVLQLKQILQSEQISKEIHNWIDLIFGYKQKGKQAELNMNVFYYLTYENSIDLESLTDLIHKTSCEAQIIHFGQTPSQLFQKPHVKRELLSEQETFQLRKEKPILKFQIKQKFERIRDFHLTQNNLTIIHKNKIIQYIVNQRQGSIFNKICIQVDFQRNLVKNCNILSFNHAIYKLFSDANYLIVTGYLDYSFRIFKIPKIQQIHQQQFCSRITYILVNKDQDLIFIGGQDGTLAIYEIKNQMNTIQIFLVHKQHFEYSITHIAQNASFYSICYGRYVSIYRVVRTLRYLLQDKEDKNKKAVVKFFRSFKNKIKINSAIIVESPLFAIIFHDNLGMKTYSINGQFINNISTTSNIKEIVLLKDKYLHDIICYVEQDKIIFISTPDLRKISMHSIDINYIDYSNLTFISNEAITIFGMQK